VARLVHAELYLDVARIIIGQPVAANNWTTQTLPASLLGDYSYSWTTLMNADQVRKHCNSLQAATEQIQWKKDRVFKIGGKMFACTGIETISSYSFKVDDERFLELTDLNGIQPAPYLARAKWIQIHPKECELSNNEITNLISRSYELVLAKLPKKTQKQLSSV
jgi:predicted DNA-binding protein (MmcQ/YjbR family)